MKNECGGKERRGARPWRAAGLCGERKALMAASHLCLKRGNKLKLIIHIATAANQTLAAVVR